MAPLEERIPSLESPGQIQLGAPCFHPEQLPGFCWMSKSLNYWQQYDRIHIFHRCDPSTRPVKSMKSENPSQIGKIDMKSLMMVPFFSKRSFLGVQKKRDLAWEPFVWTSTGWQGTSANTASIWSIWDLNLAKKRKYQFLSFLVSCWPCTLQQAFLS